MRGLRGRDLLIALSRPPPPDDRQLAIGIAGAGYEGNLTSDSTRIDGYVLSTDLAPTVLHRLGVEPPSEMSGEPIRVRGLRRRRRGGVARRADGRDPTASRAGDRGQPAGLVLATALAVAIGGGRAARRRVLPLLALTIVYVPAAPAGRRPRCGRARQSSGCSSCSGRRPSRR